MMAITMGDAAGIGPEIIVKAHAMGALEGCVVVGDPEVIRAAAQRLEPHKSIALPEVLAPQGLTMGLSVLPLGCVHPQAGLAAVSCIERAAQGALSGEFSAVITAPLNKEGLNAAGFSWPGHTELLQAIAKRHAGVEVPVRMMLANHELRVVLVTVHMALREAIEALNVDRVLQTIQITHTALLGFGMPSPRVAVAGLNPHAGEGGLFGREEIDIIAPAIAKARLLGIDASGPHAPDTVFMRARQGAFDAVVAMTHDHGLIPVKYLGLEQGVNVTLGLPFVRTSPDHGTAYDIAGKRVADPSSLIAAVAMARRLRRPVVVSPTAT
jgi:4-hydroxythreonine-4-phosphate dehydrogenase